MENSLTTILETYQRKRNAGIGAADRQALEAGQEMLRIRLQDPQELDALTVHQGADICHFLADRQGVIDLTSRYLTQTLSVEEKAWAWWELVDKLYEDERWEEAVAANEPYLDWAQAQWEQGTLSSIALLHTVSDCTWSDGWRSVGKVEAWFEHFNAIVAKVEPTPANRLERFYCLRNVCRVLVACGRDDEALTILPEVQALAQEDPNWESSWEIEVQAQDMEAGIYRRKQETDALRRAGIRAISLLESRGAAPLTPEETTRLAVQYDNVAATMFMADQYDLSIPLHRRCIELSPVSEFAYMALPAALWATTKEREPVLRLLRQGAERCRGDWFATDFREMAEFEDVREDAEFEATVRMR